MAGQHDGDRLALDRGRLLVTETGERVEQRGPQAQVGEGRVLVHRGSVAHRRGAPHGGAGDGRTPASVAGGEGVAPNTTHTTARRRHRARTPAWNGWPAGCALGTAPLVPTCCGVTRSKGAIGCRPTGGVIIAANHISFFDSVVLIQSMPRRTFFLGKAEYMKSAFTAKLFPAMGMIPLERDQTRQAMAALDVAAGVLGRGHPLAIYPEGTRSCDGRLHKGHTGVAQLALMSGAPIVPVGLVGTDRIQPIGAKRAPPVPQGRRPLRRAPRPEPLRRLAPAGGASC